MRSGDTAAFGLFVYTRRQQRVGRTGCLPPAIVERIDCNSDRIDRTVSYFGKRRYQPLDQISRFPRQCIGDRNAGHVFMLTLGCLAQQFDKIFQAAPHAPA